MTPITITELDPFAPDERTAPPQPRLRRIAVLGAFALGGIVGSVAGFTAAGGDSSNAVVPASAPSAPSSPASTSAIVHDARVGSADATARRVEAERQQRIEACTSSPRSADSLERCILGSDLQNQQLKEYQGGVGRVR